MPLLTLTTDFGHRDFHLPRLKGQLLAAVPDLTLIDVSHAIPNYDIVEGAFVFRKVWRHFPAGTIHLLSINDFYQPRGRLLASQQDGHFLICPDNGLLSLIFGQRPTEVFTLPRAGSLGTTYAAAVAHLGAGKPLAEIGKPARRITERLTFQPVIGPDYIRGAVSYVDAFDNALTNVSRELFERVGRGRAFELFIKRNAPIDGLSFRYPDVPVGEPLVRFDSDGWLEIAVNLGRAATLLGIAVEDSVQIEFS